jgi:hypothetical protein
VSGNKELRKVHVQVTGGRGKLHNAELNNLYNFYASPNIIRMTKSITKRLTGLVTRMLERGNKLFFLSLKLKGRDRLEVVNVGKKKKGLISSAIVHFLNGSVLQS